MIRKTITKILHKFINYGEQYNRAAKKYLGSIRKALRIEYLNKNFGVGRYAIIILKLKFCIDAQFDFTVHLC